MGEGAASGEARGRLWRSGIRSGTIGAMPKPLMADDLLPLSWDAEGWE